MIAICAIPGYYTVGKEKINISLFGPALDHYDSVHDFAEQSQNQFMTEKYNSLYPCLRKSFNSWLVL